MKTMRLFLFLVVVALPLSARTDPPPDPPPAAATADPWTAIKDITYQKRADFSVGTARLTEKLAGQIRELKEKRANLPETSVKDWDFAMKELTDSEVALKSTIMDISDATSETWTQVKDRVGEAWQRTQAAYDKVRASTTS